MSKDAIQIAATPKANAIFEAASQPAAYISHDEMVHFYNGHDCAKLLPADMKRVRELQETNDQLQRQLSALDAEIKNAADALVLLAERERLLIILARNTGEVLKIQVENDERLNRVAKLDSDNSKLKEKVVSQRDTFIVTHDMLPRSKHAADFFLSKSKIEKNTTELFDLTDK